MLEKIKGSIALILSFYFCISCSRRSVYTAKDSFSYYKSINQSRNIMEELKGTKVTRDTDTLSYTVKINKSIVERVYNGIVPTDVIMYIRKGTDNVYYDENSRTAIIKSYPELSSIVSDSTTMENLRKLSANAINNMNEIGLRHYQANYTRVLSYTGYPNRYIVFEFDGESENNCCFRLDEYWFYCDLSVQGKPKKKRIVQKILKKEQGIPPRE
jgi:hypothetical protein